MRVLRGETPPPHCSEVGEGVEHVLATLAHTMEESAGELQRAGAVGCGDRTGALGQLGEHTDLRQGCSLSHSCQELPFPLQPEASPALRRGRRC